MLEGTKEHKFFSIKSFYNVYIGDENDVLEGDFLQLDTLKYINFLMF